jgi:2-C-methyl-D-erythritol 2,4-cyclodiphosphate synthase
LKILKSVSRFLEASGFMVKHIDTVVVAEEPKILTFIKDMKSVIATTLSVSEDAISIKGKTNEGMGDIGSGNAIAAWAISEIGRIYVTPER